MFVYCIICGQYGQGTEGDPGEGMCKKCLDVIEMDVEVKSDDRQCRCGNKIGSYRNKKGITINCKECDDYYNTPDFIKSFNY